MSRTARKTDIDRRLKLAIIGSGVAQVVIARRAHIGEIRLSKIVTGRVIATAKERDRLAKVLGLAVEDLFPAAPPPAAPDPHAVA